MAAGTEGVQLPVPSDLRDEFLWQALKIKVLHPDQFLPVTDVKVRLCALIFYIVAFVFASRMNSGRLGQATTAKGRTGR